MPHCCNCGCDISADDKYKLCDNCKHLILPFIKFMDASTSSAVRRLLMNEKNLRGIGVTDGGMEYLLRICEIHDQQKQREREARAARSAEQNGAKGSADTSKNKQPDDHEPQNGYMEIELPLDEPLDLIRKPYGRYLTPAIVASSVLGCASAVTGALGIPAAAIVCAVLSVAPSVYTAFSLGQMLHDLSELKKRFR